MTCLSLSFVTDARDAEQLSRNKVTHILSVHDSARPMLEVRACAEVQGTPVRSCGCCCASGTYIHNLPMECGGCVVPIVSCYIVGLAFLTMYQR